MALRHHTKEKSTQRTTVHLNRGEIWALKYISAITNNEMEGLLLEGWRRGLEYMNNPKNKVTAKPKALSTKTVVKGIRYPIEYKLKTMMVLYNRELINWYQSDVIRLGVHIIIKDYSVRHPELNKIIKRYESEEA